MINLGAEIPGFGASYEVTFAAIPQLGPLAPPPSPVEIPTIVPVSSFFFDADIKIDMDATESANRFCLTIYGLGFDIYDLLVPQQTVVQITLGYDDTSSQEVMTGILCEKSITAGDQWYEATLKGKDFVFDRLQRPLQKVNQTFPDKDHPDPTIGSNPTVKAIATAICKNAGVAIYIPDNDNDPPVTTITFNDVTPFEALNMLVAKTGGNSTPKFKLQAKDGKLWMGVPDKLGVAHTTPITDGATSQPLSSCGDTAAANPLDGQIFNIAGLPALRPSDCVILGTSKFRIRSITHKLTRYGGYTCSGVAVSPDAPDEDAQQADRPSASGVAKQLSKNLCQRERKRPAVDIGDVNAYTAGKHTATLDLGYNSTPDMPSPSVQAKLRDQPVPLNDKPIASPFAFNNCGLVVPVYPKMRSLLVHGWNEPEDAVIGGFVWTAAMTPPPNQTGDWWLCLPTQFDGNGNPTGNTVDDLIQQDGQRVIQVKGMKITIGQGLLNSVGSRPTPGSDESLTIEAGNQTSVTIAAGKIEMTDGRIKLTISGGKVSIGS
jgi:hypothetical protein